MFLFKVSLFPLSCDICQEVQPKSSFFAANTAAGPAAFVHLQPPTRGLAPSHVKSTPSLSALGQNHAETELPRTQIEKLRVGWGVILVCIYFLNKTVFYVGR